MPYTVFYVFVLEAFMWSSELWHITTQQRTERYCIGLCWMNRGLWTCLTCALGTYTAN